MSRITPGSPGNFSASSSGLTDAELRASPVPVSLTGSVAVTQSTSPWVVSGTVTGTVTANAGTDLNTSLLALEAGGNLAAIKAKTDNIPALGQALATASVPVVLTAAQLSTLTPPAAITGFATSVKQSDGTQKTQIVDGSGNVIGSTANALNVHLDGGVTVLSGTFTDASDYDEDSAHVSGNKGQFLLGVRNDAGATTFTDTNGDYSPLAVDSKGAVAIQDGGGAITVDGTIAFSNSTIAVTNTGTFAVQADTELTTADLDTGAGTDTRAVVGLVGSKSGGGVLIPGDATAGLKVDLGTDNDVTVTSGNITADTELPAASALADTEGNPTSPRVGAMLMHWDGTNWNRAKGDVNGGLTMRPFQSSGADADAIANTAASFQSSSGNSIYGRSTEHIFNGATWDRVRSGGVTGYPGVSGDTAHDAADAGQPVKIGFKAVSTNVTRVASADRVDGAADLAGRQVVQLGHSRELRGKQTTTISASTAETTVVSQAASTFNDLVALIISNTSAATNTRIDFRDTTGGSVLFSLMCPAAQTTGFTLAGSSIPQTTVNTNWTAQCGTSTTDIRVLAIFEKNT